MKAHKCDFRRDSGYVRLTQDDGWLFLLLFNSYHPRQSISSALKMPRRKTINTHHWGMLCVCGLVYVEMRKDTPGEEPGEQNEFSCRRNVSPSCRSRNACAGTTVSLRSDPPKPNRIRWSAKYHEMEEESGINCGLKPAIIGRRF